MAMMAAMVIETGSVAISKSEAIMTSSPRFIADWS
jgi:5-enolpyruvylshikimate-3-phosphate synthase